MAKKPETDIDTEDSTEKTKPDALDGSSGEAGSDMPVTERAEVSTIASTLVEEMPDVQQHAIDQEATQQAETKSRWADLFDRDGNTFDPAIHKTDKAGEPTTTKLGKLIKKPGRKPGQKTQSQSGSIIGGASVENADPAQKQKIAARATGVASANMILVIGSALGGDEWQPRKDIENGMDEKGNLENAFADYFEATGKTDIPPGMALTVAIAAYALPRFTMPKTQSRVSKLKQWFVKRAADKKLKKHGLEAKAIEDTEKKEDK